MRMTFSFESTDEGTRMAMDQLDTVLADLRAHHEPALMRQWLLGPDGWEITECTVATAAGESHRTSWAPVGDTPGEAFGFEGEALLVDATRP